MKAWIPLTVAMLSLAAHAQHSPYAGEERRQIKSLPDEQVRELLAGHGLGFAKAAELNGYPGPLHVLEHADALALTQPQLEATRALMARHRQRAQELGRELVEAERRLDDAFARRTVDAAALRELTGEVGRLQAQLREEHLRTHLEQTGLLEPRQVARYNELRGYAGPGAHGGGRSHRH